jgi:hypothetical protein
MEATTGRKRWAYGHGSGGIIAGAALVAVVAMGCHGEDHSPGMHGVSGMGGTGAAGAGEESGCGGGGAGGAAPLPVTQDLRGVWSAGPADVWAVGDSGTVLHYDGRWRTETSPTTQNLQSVWATPDGRAWAVGWGATILRRDGGVWAIVASPVTVDLDHVWGRAHDDVWAVGDDGIVLHFDGLAWSVALDRMAGRLRGVWGRAADDVWVVGAGQEPDGDRASLLLHWDGASWTESYTCQAEGNRFAAGGWSAQLDDIWGSTAGPLWAAGHCQPGASFIPFGHLVRHDEYGWQELIGDTTESIGEWRSFSSVWASSATDVWVASDSGGDSDPSASPPTIIHFDGTAWTASSDLATISINDLGGSGPNDIWAVGPGGKRLHYDGTAWTASP